MALTWRLMAGLRTLSIARCHRVRAFATLIGAPFMSVMLGGLLLMTRPAWAEGDLVVLLSARTAPYHDFVNALQDGLADKRKLSKRLKIVSVADGDAVWQADVLNPGADWVIPVGSKAARAVAAQPPQVPVYHVLIPDLVFKDLPPPPAGHSALFINQPLTRQLNLIHLALPRAQNIGAVLGPISSRLHDQLTAATGHTGMTLTVESVHAADDAVSATSHVLDQVDVLLSMPDPLVLNPNAIQGVLLTAYMNRVPVVGHSRGYVKAGALMAVYSTPAHLGQELAEILLHREASGRRELPPPGYPRYYAVSVNRSVARSLDLALPSERVLLQRLRATEANR